MKYKDLYIVPILGLGWHDDILNNEFKIRTVIVGFFKVTFYKRISN